MYRRYRRFSWWLLAHVLTVGCNGRQLEYDAAPDCVQIISRAEELRENRRSRPATYDAHSGLDTAAYATTALKGCYLVSWWERVDSTTGRAPANLAELVAVPGASATEHPAHEWIADGWRRRFRYEAGSGLITSDGADGIAGTADDVRFSIRRLPR